jgi:hypothetical protein
MMGGLTDKQTIYSIDLGNLLDVFYTFHTLNLDNHQQILVCSLDVTGIGRLERMGGEHGSETPGTGWWVFGIANNLLCVFLFLSAPDFQQVK